jgi:hypothetical protein
MNPEIDDSNGLPLSRMRHASHCERTHSWHSSPAGLADIAALLIYLSFTSISSVSHVQIFIINPFESHYAALNAGALKHRQNARMRMRTCTCTHRAASLSVT